MSDLISREEAKKALGDIHPLDYNTQAYKAKIESIPSADIMECARAIKDWCKSKPDVFTCIRCPLYEKLCFTHDKIPIPCEWDLSEEGDLKNKG